MKSDKNHNNNLSAEVLTGLLGLGIVILLIHLTYNLFIVFSLELLSLDIFFLSILTTVYFMYKKFGFLDQLLFPLVLFILIMLSVFYFFHGGYRGIILFYFIIIAFSYSILLTDYRRNVLLILHAGIFLSLVGAQFYHPEWIQENKGDWEDLHYLLGFVLTISFIIYGGIIVRDDYERTSRVIRLQKMEALQKGEEIQKKNQELNEKAIQIEQINKQLSQMIEAKTTRLEKQNNQLIEYAFFNSHKVRGPLARVLGLVELLKNTDNKKEKALYLDKLDESARELDTVINEINKILIEPLE